MVGGKFWSFRYTNELPSMKFSRKACELGLLKVTWEYRLGKFFFVVNTKTFPVGEPCNNFGMLFFR